MVFLILEFLRLCLDIFYGWKLSYTYYRTVVHYKFLLRFFVQNKT